MPSIRQRGIVQDVRAGVAVEQDFLATVSNLEIQSQRAIYTADIVAAGVEPKITCARS